MVSAAGHHPPTQHFPAVRAQPAIPTLRLHSKDARSASAFQFPVVAGRTIVLTLCI